MTTRTHTKEPWFVASPVRKTWVESSCGYSIAYTIGNAAAVNHPAEENAARIVACVNACTGIPAPSHIPELIHACRQILGSNEKREMWLTTISALLCQMEGK